MNSKFIIIAIRLQFVLCVTYIKTLIIIPNIKCFTMIIDRKDERVTPIL